MSHQDGAERVEQKKRTRKLLLQAARELMVEGHQPTVPDVADRAGISRATAYRYFSSPAVMAEEAALDAIALHFENLDFRTALVTSDVVERAENVVSAILSMVSKNEPLFRNFLKIALTGDQPSRGARRTRWLREALAPLATTLPPDEVDRLVNALALLCGIETIVVLKDVCGLEPPAVDATARWVARTLVAGAGRAPVPPVNEDEARPRTSGRGGARGKARSSRQ